MKQLKIVFEFWRDIPGYERLYQASNLGRIKSLDRKVKRKDGFIQSHNGRIMSPSLNGNGYLTLSVWINGRLKRYKISQLVAMAFLNHIPNGHKMVVDHVDNNKSNNNVNNLQIITHRENDTKDLFRHGYSSKYIGVSWCKNSKNWRAAIRINGKPTYLGRFDNELEASKAYQNKLKQILWHERITMETVRKKDIGKRTYRKPLKENKPAKFVELKAKEGKAEKPEKLDKKVKKDK